LRPWGDYVHPSQPVKLYFISKQDQTLDFEIKYYFDDGTSGVYTTICVLTDDAVHEFNCNPKLLGINIEPAGKKVTYFDCRIKAGENNYSNVFRFTYDWDYCERPLFVMFANSLGGIDDVYLKGLSAENFQTEGTTVTKPAQLPSLYQRLLSQTEKVEIPGQYRPDGRQKARCATFGILCFPARHGCCTPIYP